MRRLDLFVKNDCRLYDQNPDNGVNPAAVLREEPPLSRWPEACTIVREGRKTYASEKGIIHKSCIVR